MIIPAKESDAATHRPRFSMVVSALGRLSAWAHSPRRPVSEPAMAAEPMMIKPSLHERVAIETHREDRL